MGSSEINRNIFSINMLIIWCYLTGLVLSLPLNFENVFPSQLSGLVNNIDPKKIIPNIEIRIPTPILELKHPLENIKNVKTSNDSQPLISFKKEYTESPSVIGNYKKQGEYFEQDYNGSKNYHDNSNIINTITYETTTDYTTDWNSTTTDEEISERLGGAAVASLLG
ncbi:uncharacterized protein LOC116413599 [Galleria mellonella]|uniref:Uncharacterized protein LOC116413599 n=1 Tax=Galleria mellonella TaxID=7137 RepID=A0A6J3CEG7_GALME|nr:uncharacterized protein LOC116413599 [Galleria mellonella]